MSEKAYVFDNAWEKARRRLTRLEQRLDSPTIACLTEIGVAANWQCLEIGAGGGSIAAWLCEAVGPHGRVVATDLDTRFLQALDYSQLEVLEHNIVTDALPTGPFDLVHMRFLLTHLQEREEVLTKVASAVKPGGWLCVEEPDRLTFQGDPVANTASCALFDRGVEATVTCAEQRGVDFSYGRRLYGALRERGFTSLMGRGWTTMVTGGSEEAQFEKLSCEQLQDAILSQGSLSSEEFATFLSLFDDSSFSYRRALVMSIWGQRSLD